MMTPEYFAECFSYDAESGWLIWRERPASHFNSERGCNTFNAQKAGKRAGCLSKHDSIDYIKVRLNKRNLFFAHRVIWEMHHGAIPDGIEVDHIDGCGTNNRLENLRLVSSSGNKKNRKVGCRNKSGYHGINWVPRLKKWVAQITSEGKTMHIGCFSLFEDAVHARRLAEKENGFHENHGRK